MTSAPFPWPRRDIGGPAYTLVAEVGCNHKGDMAVGRRFLEQLDAALPEDAVVVSDMADFERLHKESLTRLPGVARVNSSVAIRTVRRKTELPLR